MLLWLPDVLTDAGLNVVTLPGWETRTRAGGIKPLGVVWHHTVTPASMADAAVEKLLANGYAGLPGPLSQLGLRRDGTMTVVAAGRCNHNGYGLWGNDSIGIEAYNDGVFELWPPTQLDTFYVATAAICRYLGWDATRVKAHRETDPLRKIDPHGIDMDAARVHVQKLIDKTPSLTPSPLPSLGGSTVAVPLPVLRQGDRGGGVKSLQTLLVTKAAQNIVVDGVFGVGTLNAVRNVQRFFGLTVDGVVGRDTWGVMFL